MSQLTVYRIITYILLPFATLFALLTLVGLLVALANPQALLGVFFMACIVIYTFTSFSFLQKIGPLKPAKPSLKDWIKVNAYVSVFFSTTIIIQTYFFFHDPNIAKAFIEQFISAQGSNASVAVLTPEKIRAILNGVFEVFAAYAAVLLVHIFLTFRLLRQFASLFAAAHSSE